MRMRDVMQVDVEVVGPGSTLAEAAYSMMVAGVGLLPVSDGERFVGIITDRDIIKRAFLEGFDASAIKVREIMTASVVSCAEGADTDKAPLPLRAPASRKRGGWLSGLIGTLLLGGCVAPVKSAGSDSAADISGRRFLFEAVVGNWWPASARAARLMVEEYGVPDEVRSEKIAWNDNGPWKRTVVRNETPLYGAQEDPAVVEQTLARSLTPQQAVDLAAFDRRLRFDRDKSELTAASASEERNFLRHNLADDIIVRGTRPSEAKARYERMLALSGAGKSSDYLSGLRASLDAPSGEQADDQSHQSDDE